MYYIAVVCPPQVNEKVMRYKLFMKEQFGCVVALKSPAHITFIPPFWMAESRETELQTVLQSIDAATGDIIVELDGLAHFGKRVLFVSVKENPGLEALKIQVEKHFTHALPDIVKIDNRPFHPHITIANRDMKPHHFLKAWEYFSGKIFIESFSITAISLLKLSAGRWSVIGNKE